MNRRRVAAISRNVSFLVIWTGFVLSGCNQPRETQDSVPSEAFCIADSLGSLRHIPDVPTCASDDWACRVKCQFGSGASCLGLAYSSEKDSKPKENTQALYLRACVLGEANACTNYAASIWVEASPDEQSTCVQRIFEKACLAKEPFACGMVGRLMLESNPPQGSEGRRYLEAACDQVGGFSCRVLAKHLETGKIGDYDTGLISTLLSRACNGGDQDACGTHATASETFQ